MFKAKVVLDSVGPNGRRLISVEATYPRIIHSELMTHRDRARNAASSRAIPWKRVGKSQKPAHEIRNGEKIIGKGIFSEISTDPNETYQYYVANCMYSMIMTDPFIPIVFGKEKAGMATGEAFEGEELDAVTRVWLEARNDAVMHADKLAHMGVHKSICNRITEPFMWITVLMTSTEWKNFFRLRCHPMAEVHFQKMAGMVKAAIEQSVPRRLEAGDWHLPYFSSMKPEEDAAEKQRLQDSIPELQKDGLIIADTFNHYAKMISAGRSARLSYLTHDGVRDMKEDVKLCKLLIERDDDVLHASPLEHVAMASHNPHLRSGPFKGWHQYRKDFANENIEG